ncbi:MAG: GSCFA domain-containing protein [Planctomycetes bacterium]|nr:GSCFA domain-containing protein [Planctomycetota bacterium]
MATEPRRQHDGPYRNLPDRAVWGQSVGRRPIETIFPVDEHTAPLARDTRVASAGSCFAQRIAEHLGGLGLDYLVTEPGPAFLAPDDARRLGYGVYSARYGNVYTAAQLVQLAERAFGHFEPAEPVWAEGERFVDPFRPGIAAAGFVSPEECLEDRSQHLAAVRTLLLTADVLVFTLGLTEAWRCRADGAMLPVCPGAGHGGTFAPSRYEFVNFRVDEVVDHLDRFVTLARTHNPELRLILSVSPVPLVATCSDRHVLTATAGSKAVLRVACDEIRRRHERIDYFPAFEIVQIGGPDWAFESNRRAVKPTAVRHIMDCFALQFGLEPAREPLASIPRPAPSAPAVVCDEDEIVALLARERNPR